MKKYVSKIKKIKGRLDFLQKENFKPAINGTHHKVFISKNFVIRFCDDNPALLSREADFLKQISYPLIPKIIWMGKIEKSAVMIENRLSGENINLIWKRLSEKNRKNIIKQVIQFLRYLRNQKKKHIYSVNIGKKYNSFYNYLTNNINKKISNIKKNEQTKNILKDLLLIINKIDVKKLFANKQKTAIVHGDLIIHNLLTDGKNLTGVLDWELALFGDPDYDLCRLFYYQECAMAYQEQGIDETFESDYMNKLTIAILKSNLIKNRKQFQKKYQFIRAIFYINALNWATNSNSPIKNIKELVEQWNKNKKIG